MRPDEAASLSEIERDKKNKSRFMSGIKTAGALTGAGIVSRLSPFFSQFIPVDLAMKGISKISPKIGDFLKRGQSMGLDLKEGIDFVKEKMNPKEIRNIIQQYSPELHQFIDQSIKAGKAPLEAGALAQLQDKFKKVINKISEDHKTDWSSILENVYGGSAKASPNPQDIMEEKMANFFKKQGPKNVPDDLKKVIDVMLDKGIDPVEMVDYFRSSYPDYIEKVEKESGRPFEMSIDDYFTSGRKKKKKGLVDSLQEDLKREYGNKNEVDAALLASFEKILKM